MRQRTPLASLVNWHNSYTDATPAGVARVFATSVVRQRLPHLFDLALQALDLYESGNAKGAKNLCDTIPRTEFGSSLGYLTWAQFKGFFLKAPMKGSERLCEIAARKKFLDAEMACKRANRRLRWFWRRPDRENPIYRVILTRARELISKTLGTFTESTMEQLLDLSRPGGGSAVGTTNPLLVDLPWKLGRKTELVVTPDALVYGRMLVERSDRWLSLHVEFPDKNVRHAHVPYVATNTNRVAFVPKDATTHRTIAVEPHLNICLQLGVDAYIKRRLRGVGVDLSTQRRNQDLARAGAIGWMMQDPLVTLDLASASDTLCQGLVERLLPSAWLDYLGNLRSPYYRMGKELPVEYQKWSSMGNGYTFSLETLIFWAIAKACSTFSRSRERLGVYGDDIVLPRGTAGILIEVLGYCGFKVNTDKSALFGPFRESCGGDYWFDQKVTPVYLRDEPFLRPTDIYRVNNTLHRELYTDELRRFLVRAHRGRPIVFGLATGDPSGCWIAPLHYLIKSNMVRWKPDEQSWTQRVCRFRPTGRDPTILAGYAAALLGAKLHADPEWLVLKSNLRRRGKWSLSRVQAG
jgi:hypothetical protein